MASNKSRMNILVRPSAGAGEAKEGLPCHGRRPRTWATRPSPATPSSTGKVCQGRGWTEPTAGRAPSPRSQASPPASTRCKSRQSTTWAPAPGRPMPASWSSEPSHHVPRTSSNLRCRDTAYTAPWAEGAVLNATNRINVYKVSPIPGEMALPGAGGRRQGRRLPGMPSSPRACGLVAGRKGSIVAVPGE